MAEEKQNIEELFNLIIDKLLEKQTIGLIGTNKKQTLINSTNNLRKRIDKFLVPDNLILHKKGISLYKVPELDPKSLQIN